jgi:glycerophosphoryl diester phosphodiesterase
MSPVPPRPLLLGHRGYRARCPENTLLSFRQAITCGAGGVECDLQKSADGRYVIIHDPTTERVSGVSGDVARMSGEELRRLDVGRGERIPLLEELLSMLPADAYLDLELKKETLTEADCGPIAEILEGGIERERLMISSFESELLLPFRCRGYTVGFLVGEEARARGAVVFAATLLRLRPQYLNLPVQAVEILGVRRAKLLFRVFRACGFSLLFWTVNSIEEAAVVLPYARIVVTDEVELLAGALTRRWSLQREKTE